MARRVDFMTIGTYLGTLVALIDQVSKFWVLEHVRPWPDVMPLTSWMNFVLSWNRGVTFGLMNGPAHAAMPYFFIAVGLAILLFLFNWLRKTESLLVTFALGLVIGGAIGNIVDRVRYGAVVDFIDLHAMGYHWYVFNVADSAIVGGVILLLVEHMLGKIKKQ